LEDAAGTLLSSNGHFENMKTPRSTSRRREEVVITTRKGADLSGDGVNEDAYDASREDGHRMGSCTTDAWLQ